MNQSELISLFPMEAYITQEIIDNSSRYLTKKCIGALTLKTILPEEFKDKASWGDTKTQEVIPGYIITTEEGISMMDVIEPQKVTFIITKKE